MDRPRSWLAAAAASGTRSDASVDARTLAARVPLHAPGQKSRERLRDRLDLTPGQRLELTKLDVVHAALHDIEEHDALALHSGQCSEACRYAEFLMRVPGRVGYVVWFAQLVPATNCGGTVTKVEVANFAIGVQPGFAQPR